MVPPTQEMLDPACDATFSFAGALQQWLRGNEQNTKLCDREGIQVDIGAPLSRWIYGGSFDTAAECQAEQKKPLTGGDEAMAGSLAGLAKDSGLSKEDFLRARKYSLMAAQCIATDDPRLKE